ncbi:MAG: diguanylate cyclase [Acidobacteriota bacterium]
MRRRRRATWVVGIAAVMLAAVAVADQANAPATEAAAPAAVESDNADPVAAARHALQAATAHLASGDLVSAEAECRRGLALLEGRADRAADEARIVLHDALGRVLYAAGKVGESVLAHRAGLALARSLGDVRAEFAGLQGVAVGHFVLGRYADALESALEALRVADGHGLDAEAAQACHLAGLVHRNLGQPGQAKPLLSRAAEAARRARDTPMLVRALNEEGNALHELGDDAAAEARKLEALELAGSVGDDDGLADIANDLAVIAHARGRFDESRRYLEQSYAISRRIGDHRERVIGAVNLAGAVAEEEPARARALYAEALKIAVEARLPVEEEVVREAMATGLAERGDHAGAYRELVQAYRLRRSTLTEASTRRVADLRALYDAERREAEIALLQRDREIQTLRVERAHVRQRWWAGAFAAAVLFAGVLAVGYRMRTRSARALAAAKARVEELARTDALTGLRNRRYATERLHDEGLRSRRGQSRFAVALADLDEFKRINDTFGHACGDEVLARFAQILQSTVRSLDVAARWGGEEFILILPGTDLNGAVTAAEKVRARLRDWGFGWNGEPVTLTATFGVAECTDGDVPSCLRAADDALYEGKRAGRDTVIAAPAAGPTRSA